MLSNTLEVTLSGGVTGEDRMFYTESPGHNEYILALQCVALEQEYSEEDLATSDLVEINITLNNHTCTFYDIGNGVPKPVYDLVQQTIYKPVLKST